VDQPGARIAYARTLWSPPGSDHVPYYIGDVRELLELTRPEGEPEHQGLVRWREREEKDREEVIAICRRMGIRLPGM
jgi:hypothetical protein